MSEFENSRWADSEFSQGYRDESNFFLPFRSQFIEVVKSLYGHFVSSTPAPRILDLGCGDGLFVQELLKSFKPQKAVLVDGSAEMLNAARKRLAGKAGTHYLQASFQQLIAEAPLADTFDFIYSSLAVHHIPFDEKKDLYSYIYKHLASDGWFVHYDVVLPPSEDLEKWYLNLWEEWINACSPEEQLEKLLETPKQYKGNPDNMPDSLDAQLEVLQDAGFHNVDCFYRYGIFSLFGGSR